MRDFDTEKEASTLREAHEHEEEDVAKLLSNKHGLSYTDLSLQPIDVEALRVIPEEKARELNVVAFAKAGKHLSVAVLHPGNSGLAALFAELASKEYTVEQFLVSRRSMEKAFSRYADLTYATVSKAGSFAVSPEALEKMRVEAGSIAGLQEVLEKAMQEKTLDRITRVIEAMLGSALSLKASDIHLEPEEARVRLRLRIDGLLTDVFYLDRESYHLLSSRIKLISGVKLNVANRAQDGRFTIQTGSIAVEIRASFIPESYGESIVLRILDPNAASLNIDDLGINPKLLARLKKEITKSNGMLLTTGPTGSGKSTTLYAFLKAIQTPEIKIITIEQPIEYHLEGIVQTQADEKDYTFAAGLRSIVRQDPDVIMVGEIRDKETAEIAIQAALTGHFVFSTLHTNNASGTFPRLVDLGADPKSFGSAISVSMAQRLVRRLDPERKKERPLTDEEKKMIEVLFKDVTDPELVPPQKEKTWEPVPEGEATGYKGRIGVHEAIFMDDEISTFLRDNPAENEIAKLAKKQEYLSIAQDAVHKALQGITSLEEVAKAVDLPF